LAGQPLLLLHQLLLLLLPRLHIDRQNCRCCRQPVLLLPPPLP
jgi:hypothetical protein